MNLLIRWLLNAVALYVVTELRWGAHFPDPNLGTILVTALVLGLVNLVVRPVMILLTLPFTVATFGLFLLLVNALALGIVAALTPLELHGFWGAILASMMLSLLNWIIARLLTCPR
mgnify:FL=1